MILKTYLMLILISFITTHTIQIFCFILEETRAEEYFLRKVKPIEYELSYDLRLQRIPTRPGNQKLNVDK